MDIGVIFPQTEVGGDPGAVRALGQAAADLGYRHFAAYDHVLGGDIEVLGDLGGPYTIDNTFREPLTMFAYLAGCTNLAFATSILIGPQRQTALLAKQAAEVDLLCGGRFRLGLGIGWNKLEYDALGVPFEERTAILEEQVVVLRALWTERSVTIDGRYHHIRASGLAPPAGAATHPHLDRRPRPGRAAPGGTHRRRLVSHGPARRRPRRRARAHSRGGGGGRARPVELRIRGQARILRPRPRKDRRARPALAGGRGNPPFAQHHARRVWPTRTRTLPRCRRWPKSCCRQGRVRIHPPALREWAGERPQRLSRCAPGVVRRPRRRAGSALVGRLLLVGGHRAAPASATAAVDGRGRATGTRLARGAVGRGVGAPQHVHHDATGGRRARHGAGGALRRGRAGRLLPRHASPPARERGPTALGRSPVPDRLATTRSTASRRRSTTQRAVR